MTHEELADAFEAGEPIGFPCDEDIEAISKLMSALMKIGLKPNAMMYDAGGRFSVHFDSVREQRH